MTNAAFGKKVLAIAVLACLCAALIAVPAYGFYYVHDDSVSDSSDGLGSYEVFMVVDETAVGGDVHSDLMFVPAGSTADVVLTEGIISSENQNGLDAIHNYDVQSVADYSPPTATTLRSACILPAKFRPTRTRRAPTPPRPRT